MAEVTESEQAALADTPAQPQPARDERGKFVPGVSGNPSGRPAGSILVRQAIAKRGAELVETLLGIALPPAPPADMPPKDIVTLLARRSGDQLKALELLLAYWIGKPIASVEVSGHEGEPLHSAGFREAARELLADPEARKALRSAVRGGGE